MLIKFQGNFIFFYLLMEKSLLK